MRYFYYALLLCLSVGSVLAQPNTYDGSWTLSAGDLEAGPVTREVTALGNDDVSEATGVEENCGGMVDAGRPTLFVTFEGPSLHLSAAPSSDPEADLVLAVQRGDGSWLCVDDAEGAETLHPAIRVEEVNGDRLSVHVGRWGGEEEPVDALIMAGLPGQEDLSGYMLDAPNGTEGGGAPYSPAEFDAGVLEFDRGAVAGTSVHISGEGDSGRIDLDTRGEVRNPLTGEKCAGYLPLEPNLEVQLEEGVDLLSILATFESDAVMAVRSPEEEWFCSDDAEGYNPGVQVNQASPGNYSVWIGLFSGPSDVESSGVVSVTTAPLSDEPRVVENPNIPGSPAMRGALDPDMESDTSVRISGNGDSAAVTLLTSGGNGNPLTGDECVGYFPGRANLRVQLENELDVMTVLASFERDAAMVLRTPEGAWYCSDDADGVNPGVQVNQAVGGDYLVWVGPFSGPDSEEFSGSVSVTTEPFSNEPRMVDNPAFPSGSATLRTFELDAPARTTARISGEGDSAEAEVIASGETANPLIGDACRGYLPTGPNLEVQLESGVEVLSIFASLGSDGVMALRTPEGDWFCSDDVEDLHPGIQVEDASSGPYSVWVGLFGPGGEDVASVSIDTDAALGPFGAE